MPGKTGDQLKPGDLVFAKMKGFPPWPARVCKAESNYKKRVPVFFFGTHQIGHLPPQNIVPFVGNKVKYGNSGVRIKGFTEGMWEIQNTPGVGSKPRNNTQSTPAKSPSTSAAKATSATKASPGKSSVSSQAEPSKQVTDEEAKTPSSTPAADKNDNKVVRRRRSNVKGGASAVALATTRATRRSSPAETTSDSTQTSVVVMAAGAPAVLKKKRGRKPKSVLTESTTGTTTTDSPTAFETASHKQREGANDRESGSTTMSTVKEKSPDVPFEPKGLRATSQEIVSTSCGDSGEATKPAVIRRKAGKVVAEQKMNPADVVEDTPVSKRLKASRTEPPSKSLEREEEQTEDSGTRGLMKKEGKEVVQEMCQETDGKKILMMEKPEAKRRGRKRKVENLMKDAEKQTKTEEEESQLKKDFETEKGGITESEENETIQRQGVRGGRGRRGRRPGTRTKEWRGSTEKQQVTEVTAMTVGKKRGRKRKARDTPGEEVEAEVKEEDEEQQERIKPSKADDKEIKKRKFASEEKKEEDVHIDDDGLETETRKKKGSPLVDNERQHHLAAKRDSVLTSLRGLLKTGRRGRRRKEASHSYLKSLDRAQKTGGLKASEKRRGRQSNITSTLSEEKKVPKKLEDKTKEKEKYEKKTKRREMMEVKDEEPQKAKITNEEKEKGKDFEAKEDERTKPGEKKDMETKEKPEEERSADDSKKNKREEKSERKIIGKIVKASAGQKAKVQMKTVIGGVIKTAEAGEEKKKKIEERNRERSSEPETKGLANPEEKNAERRAGVEEKTKNVARKEKLATVEKDKRMRRGDDGEQKKLKKDSATTLGKNSDIKPENEAMAAKKVKVDERQGKPEREHQPKAEEMVQTQSAGGDDDDKIATPQTAALDGSGDKTSLLITEAEPGQPDGCGEEEDEVDERRSDSSDGEKAKRQRKSASMTLTDSTLHRIHGDIRISLKTDNPDINKCLMALDQLSMVYVTSKHIQRHTELVVTLRKLRCYRASQTIMDKASMLYNRFKNAYLLGEGEEVVSAGFLHTLLEEKEREEAQRAQRCRQEAADAELMQEVKMDMGQGHGAEGGNAAAKEATGGAESRVQKDAR